MIIEKRFKLPELKPNQVWCCVNGCGECETVELKHERMVEMDLNQLPSQRILNAEYHYYQASACCQSDVFLWDKENGQEVSFEEIEELIQ